MAIIAKTGSLTSPAGTGNQSYEVGFTPKVIIFFASRTTNGAANDGNGCLGVATSSTQRWALSIESTDGSDNTNNARSMDTTKCLGHVNPGGASMRFAADLVSFDATAFTLNWTTTEGAGVLFYYVVLGGDGLLVQAGNITSPAGTGNQTYSGIAFTPKAIIFGHSRDDGTDGPEAHGAHMIGAAISSSSRWVMYGTLQDNVANSNTENIGREDRCVSRSTGGGTFTMQADFVQMQTDGFTLNWDVTGGSGWRVGYLALGGDILVAIGNATEYALGGQDSITDVGFVPSFEIFASHSRTTLPAGVGTHGRLMQGVAVAASDQAVHTWTALDAAATEDSAHQGSLTSCILHITDGAGGTTLAQAALVSQNGNGFTLNWTTTDGSSRISKYLAVGDPLSVVAVRRLRRPDWLASANRMMEKAR
jgi:hypothetical protein